MAYKIIASNDIIYGGYWISELSSGYAHQIEEWEYDTYDTLKEAKDALRKAAMDCMFELDEGCPIPSPDTICELTLWSLDKNGDTYEPIERRSSRYAIKTDKEPSNEGI